MPMAPESPCVACGWISNFREIPGGPLLETPSFRVHGFDGRTAIAGWAVVTSREHVRGPDGLSPAALAELGPLVARVMRAQKAALRAEHCYLFAIGDVVPHCHFH